MFSGVDASGEITSGCARTMAPPIPPSSGVLGLSDTMDPDQTEGTTPTPQLHRPAGASEHIRGSGLLILKLGTVCVLLTPPGALCSVAS
jgi:hypothetical protein